jgi:hypothetical protein
VRLVDGDASNIKITTPRTAMAEAIARRAVARIPQPRTGTARGTGYDLHRSSRTSADSRRRDDSRGARRLWAIPTPTSSATP